MGVCVFAYMIDGLMAGDSPAPFVLGSWATPASNEIGSLPGVAGLATIS